MIHLRMPHRSSSFEVECCRWRGAWSCGLRYALTNCVESVCVGVRFGGWWWLNWLVYFNLFLRLRYSIFALYHEQTCLCTGHPPCWHSLLQYTAFLSLQKHHRASASRWQMQHAWMTSKYSSIEWTPSMTGSQIAILVLTLCCGLSQCRLVTVNECAHCNYKQFSWCVPCLPIYYYNIYELWHLPTFAPLYVSQTVRISTMITHGITFVIWTRCVRTL